MPNKKLSLLRLMAVVILLFPATILGQSERLNYFAESIELIRGSGQDTVYLNRSVEFERGKERLYCDSAILIPDSKALLFGRVRYLDDTLRELTADRLTYDVATRIVLATGERVTLISRLDSIRAVGTEAYYCRDTAIVRLRGRPTVFLNFPDSTNLIRIDADFITYDAEGKIAYADGNVAINQNETASQAGRAIMYLSDDILALYDNPSARRRDSEIKGDTLVAYSNESQLERLLVMGNAQGNFLEPSAKDSTLFDRADLTSREMEFNLQDGQIRRILASGQAFSFYSPAARDSTEVIKNNTSGDTIQLLIEDRRLTTVNVIGGAEGEYLSGQYKGTDTARQFIEDTVSYKSDFIDYTLNDSIISLRGSAFVTSKNLSLEAHRIRYNTANELVTAFDDSVKVDTSLVYMPVILRDGNEELIGSYLEYSMDTEKGMIRKSRSEYEKAYYRGQELFRETKDIYYVEDGSYTSCDRESSHFHFQSARMKMIERDRIIARPVIFYIEKLPLMIVPYYVFSIKPGRHSGFLPFRIGNFERGAGSISNVGYYWAASEYWDLQASMDYYENFGFAYHGTMRYNWRYHLSGSLTGSYATDASRDSQLREIRRKRWEIRADHYQTFSPTFSLRADGRFISDKTYYTDFSTDLDDRLNRDIRSQVSLSKQWKGASISAQFLHTVALDKDSRTDELPTATFSIPGRALFGSPAKIPGRESEAKWYQSLYIRYSANLRNHSSRTTDSTGFRSRREYMVVTHFPQISLAPFSLLRYLRIGPAFEYNETWYKIFETDQSLAAGIDAKQLYRRYAYSASVSASTDIYGIVAPKLWGLEGLRHVFTPQLGFSWAPEITRHNNIRSYTGAGGGGAKQRTLSVSVRNIFQAKVKSGETTRTLELLTVSSSFGYNFEASGRKFSNLTTTAQTSLTKKIRMSATLVHDFYEPGTDRLNFWSPYLTRLTISTGFNTGGVIEEALSVDTSLSPEASQAGSGKGKRSWSFGLTHYYAESGRDSLFNKTHNINFNLSLSLTAGWKLKYYQTYDIVRDRTVSRRIEVERDLHCWKGYFYWIPDGSNRGYYFRINIIAIPDVKFEKSESGIKGMFGR